MGKPVTDNIRIRSEQIKNNQDSNICTGLVVQGGGMRGVYSMASLMALEECGLGGAFDHVVGSSAGAINGGYLLAHQAKLAVTIYLDDISNKKFVNFMRFRKVVDIDYLVDDVLKKQKKLDLDRLRSSKNMLHIILTDYLTAKSHVATNKDPELDIMEAFRATAALPILYNKVVQIKGRGYVDGGVVDAVPLLPAIELGCTDILVVLTREPSFRRRALNLFFRIIKLPFLRNHPPQLKERILGEDDLFNQTMNIIEHPDKLEKEIRIDVVYPSDLNKIVSRTTTDRAELIECALMARNDTRALLGLELLNDNPFSVS